MDTTIQAYRRRMFQGEGSWNGYLRLMYRAGYSTGDALECLMSDGLSDHHKQLVKMHLDHKGSANFEKIGTNKQTPVVETIKILLETGLAKR